MRYLFPFLLFSFMATVCIFFFVVTGGWILGYTVLGYAVETWSAEHFGFIALFWIGLIVISTAFTDMHGD